MTAFLHLRRWALAFAAGSCLAATAATAQAFTLTDARALKPSQLGTKLLGILGRDVDEARVRSTSEHLPSLAGPARIDSVSLAWKPVSAGFPGLCEAKTVFVSFKSSASGETTPDDFFVSKAYRIVGSAQPLPDVWNDKYGHWLDEKCRQAGPVLQGDEAPGFFQGRFEGHEFGAGDASFAARALEVARQYGGAVQCTPDRSVAKDALCEDRQHTLTGLSLDNFYGADMQRCTDDPHTLCATFRFARPDIPRSDGDHMISVTLATDATKNDPPPDQIRIRSLKLDGYNIVY